MKHLRTLALILTALIGACARPVTPWEETALTRATVEWLEPEAPGHLTGPRMLERGSNLGALEWPLRLGAGPNLFDLHDSRGALAQVSVYHEVPTYRILRAADLPVDIGWAGGTTFYDGEARRIALGIDKTLLELPRALQRQSLPYELGVISATSNGLLRATGGEAFSAPISPDDLEAFVDRFVRFRDLEEPPEEPTGEPEASVLIQIQRRGANVHGRRVPIAEVGIEVEAALGERPRPLLLLAEGEARYGDLVAALDQVYRLAAAEIPVSLALVTRRNLERPNLATSASAIVEAPLDDPVLVIKADVDTPCRVVDRILDAAKGRVARVVLLTDLDTSNRSLIDSDTWLGGLPGGLVLPLASEDAVLTVAGP